MIMGGTVIIIAAVLVMASVASGVIAAMTPDERAKLFDVLIQKTADRETKWRDRHVMRRWGG
jgi:uncharacterized iron-regulated membrane protein